MNPRLFTVGCSVLTEEGFIALLRSHGIDSVADVRSVPYSRHTPQFSMERISRALEAAGIRYFSFKDEFGARRAEEEAYTGNRVSFAKVYALPAFLAGIERIRKGLAMGLSIALMCTEKDPLDCHRFAMVARGIDLVAGIPSLHLHSSGELETTEELEDRAIRLFKLRDDLFVGDRAEAVKRVYETLEAKNAFVKEG